MGPELIRGQSGLGHEPDVEGGEGGAQTRHSWRIARDSGESCSKELREL